MDIDKLMGSYQKELIMNSKYDKCVKQWNEIFSRINVESSFKLSSGNEALDKELIWICNGTHSILDFGCGNGSMLFLCAMNGSKFNIGIDLSETATEYARQKAEKMPSAEFIFIAGSIEKLKKFEDTSVDAVILSNIIDNLYPEDAEVLISEIERILKVNGKVLVKLNPYITMEQIKEWNIKIIKDNLLDDGLILWNNTTEQWGNFLESKFIIDHFTEIYYPEHEQFNRVFGLVK